MSDEYAEMMPCTGGIQWGNDQPRSFLNPRGRETNDMQTKEQLEAKRNAAVAEAERLTEAIMAREKYGVKDPFKNGTVLKVEMRYSSSNVTYTYGVIKVASRYWLSGKVQQGIAELEGRRAGWTWENFVAWLAAGDATVWRATGLEQVL